MKNKSQVSKTASSLTYQPYFSVLSLLSKHEFEFKQITPKAFANFSPRLERSDNLGLDHKNSR